MRNVKLRKYLGVLLMVVMVIGYSSGVSGAVSCEDIPAVNMKYDNGDTLLHAEIRKESVNKSVVKMLIDNGADVNAKDSEGNTTLHVAIKKCFIDKDIVKMLVDNGADVNAKDSNGVTPIEYVFDDDYCLRKVNEAIYINSEIGIEASFILGIGSKCGSVVYFSEEETSLVLPKDRAYVMKLLIKNGADGNMPDMGKYAKGEVIAGLSTSELDKIFRVAIENGVDIDNNYVNIYRYGKKDTIALLNRKEGDKYEGKDGVFFDAVLGLDKSKIKSSIKNGADINVRFVGNQTALHIAVFKDKKDIVKLLLSSGADVCARNDEGMTPLQIACDRGNKDILNLLLEHSEKE